MKRTERMRNETQWGSFWLVRRRGFSRSTLLCGSEEVGGSRTFFLCVLDYSGKVVRETNQPKQGSWEHRTNKLFFTQSLLPDPNLKNLYFNVLLVSLYPKWKAWGLSAVFEPRTGSHPSKLSTRDSRKSEWSHWADQAQQSWTWKNTRIDGMDTASDGKHRNHGFWFLQSHECMELIKVSYYLFVALVQILHRTQFQILQKSTFSAVDYWVVTGTFFRDVFSGKSPSRNPRLSKRYSRSDGKHWHPTIGCQPLKLALLIAKIKHGSHQLTRTVWSVFSRWKLLLKLSSSWISQNSGNLSVYEMETKTYLIEILDARKDRIVNVVSTSQLAFFVLVVKTTGWKPEERLNGKLRYHVVRTKRHTWRELSSSFLLFHRVSFPFFSADFILLHFGSKWRRKVLKRVTLDSTNTTEKHRAPSSPEIQDLEYSHFLYLFSFSVDSRHQRFSLRFHYAHE